MDGDRVESDREAARLQLAEFDSLFARIPARPMRSSPIALAFGLALWLTALMLVSIFGLHPFIAAAIRMIIGLVPAVVIAQHQERRGVIASRPPLRARFFVGCAAIVVFAVLASIALALGSPWWIAGPGHIVLMLLGFGWVWHLSEIESHHRLAAGVGFIPLAARRRPLAATSTRVGIVAVLLTCGRMERELLADAVGADVDAVTTQLLSLESDGLVRRSKPWIDVSGAWYQITRDGRQACRSYRAGLVERIGSEWEPTPTGRVPVDERSWSEPAWA